MTVRFWEVARSSGSSIIFLALSDLTSFADAHRFTINNLCQMVLFRWSSQHELSQASDKQPSPPPFISPLPYPTVCLLLHFSEISISTWTTDRGMLLSLAIIIPRLNPCLSFQLSDLKINDVFCENDFAFCRNFAEGCVTPTPAIESVP